MKIQVPVRLTVLALLLLLVSLAAPAVPASTAAGSIDPALLSQLEQDDQATFIVLLQEQADLAPAYDIRDWDARGRFVLDALRETAGRTQPAVLAALHTLQAAGHVAETRPYYIVNAIVVRGDHAAAQSLARRTEVAAVLPEPLIMPIAPVPVPAGAAPDTVEWNIQMIGADDVWATYGVTGTGVVVANIDSGVEYTHPALVTQYRGNLDGGNYDHDYNWWDPTHAHPYPQPISGPYPLGSGHGTATMGVLVGDDGGGNQIGVAPGAKWIAAYGFSGIDGLLSATQWMIAPTARDGNNPDPTKRPHIVSNSWGAPGAMLLFEPLLAAQRAAGIFNAFAAGNNGTNGCGTLVSPADNPSGFAVGATDQSDGIAFFSSRGPNGTKPWMDTYGIGPEVSAPGYPIRTSSPGGGYYSSGGTSFATPHVAGTAALLWSAEPDLVGRVAETEAILRGTAVPKHTWESCGGVPGGELPNNTFGWGRIDALAAVEFAWHAGTLAGTGAPAGAEVQMLRDGHTVRTTADAAGAFNFPLGAGTYTVTVEAYGYAPWTQAGLTIAQDLTTTLNVSLAPLLEYTLTGVVQEGGRVDPMSALLGLRDTPVLMSTDPATGAYSATVAAGAYRLRTIARGYEPEEQLITVTGDVTVNVSLAPRLTYYARDSRSTCGPAFDWIDATDGTPYYLGFMDFERIDDPAHPFPFYGVPKSSYFVGSFGFVGFSAGHPDPTLQDTPTMVIPFEGPPNDVVYAFLNILNPAYGGQGIVYQKVVDDRYMVIEFHEVEHWVSGFPETFEFVFDTETGIVTTQYLTVSQPGSTTVGLENFEGSDGLLYSYENSAGLTNSLAVAFYPVFGPPPADQEPGGVYGALSGTVYVSGTTIPIPGAVVTATSYLQALTTTAGPAGPYLFSSVCADLYTLQAAAPGYRPSEPAVARLRWAGDVAVHDLFLEPLQPAEPVLTKTVCPAEVPYGEYLTYTLAYANDGEGPLAGVLSDTLPFFVGYITSTPPGVYQDGTVTWMVNLPAGGSGEATILAYLIPPPVSLLTATITNTAYLFWAGPVLSSSAAFAVLPLPGPEPALTKTVGPAQVLPGAFVTYTIALANPGPGDLWGGVLTDTLPAEVAYITSTPPGLYEDGMLTWYADLPAGGRLDVTVLGQLTATAVPGTTVTNTAHLFWMAPVLSSTAVFQVAAPCQEVSGAVFSWTPLLPLVGQEVVFTGTATGTLPITYDWQLDVGSWKAGPVVTYTYTLPGTYTVVLTATNCGGSGVATVQEAVVVRRVAYAVYLPLVFRRYP